MWRNLHLYKRDSISLLLISVIIDYKTKGTNRHDVASYKIFYVNAALPQKVLHVCRRSVTSKHKVLHVCRRGITSRSYMYEDVALTQNIRSYMYEDAALPQNIRFYMYVCHTVIYWILFYKIKFSTRVPILIWWNKIQ